MIRIIVKIATPEILLRLVNIFSFVFPGHSHLRGPLDGSLYAKVNKSRKPTNGEVVLREDSPDQVNAVEDQTTSEPVVTSNCTKPNVVVLNGNRIIYKPQPIFGKYNYKVSKKPYYS